MTTCDVLIVGGGPAGSACAWNLRQAGVDVLILDRKTFPRDKTCAGWITPPVLDILRIDALDYQRGRVLEPIHAFCTSLMGRLEVMTDFGKPISYGIRRCEFDQYLLQRSGSRTRLGEPLKSLVRADGQWLVNGQIRAAVVVGAGGHFCPVARHLGAKPGHGELAVVAKEIEVELSDRQLRDCPVPPGIPFLYFCDDLKGYGWYYRKGNFLNVGLGREDDQGLSTHVAAFREFLEERGKIPRDLPRTFAGHAYVLYGHGKRRLMDDGVLLIGDAAGLSYSESGEGIRPAVESGLMAAEVIRAAAGRYGRAELAPYVTRLTARYGKKLTWSPFDYLPLGLSRFIVSKLLTSPWFVRNTLVEHWFLHKNEPPLEIDPPFPAPRK